MPEQEGSLEDEVLALARGKAEEGKMEREVLDLARQQASGSTEDEAPDLVGEAAFNACIAPIVDLESFMAYLVETRQKALEETVRATEAVWTEHLKINKIYTTPFIAYSNLAQLLVKLGAEQRLKQTIEDMPTGIITMFNYSLVKSLCEAKQYDLALKIAEGAHDDRGSDYGKGTKSGLYILIAETQIEQGRTAEAKGTLSLALEAAGRIKDGPRHILTLAKIARLSSLVNGSQVARKKARNAIAKYGWISAARGNKPYKEIAESKAELGDYTGALKEARMSREDEPRALLYIIDLHLKDGNIRPALEIAKSMDKGKAKSKAYFDISCAQAEKELFDEAEDSLRYISDSDYKEAGRKSLAVSLAKAGRNNDASRTAQTFGDYIAIANAHIDEGNHPEANKALITASENEPKDPDYEDEAYLDLALTSVKLGCLNAAKSTRDLIPNYLAHFKSKITLEIAAHHLDRREYREAKAAIDETLNFADALKQSPFHTFEKHLTFHTIASYCHDMIKSKQVA